MHLAFFGVAVAIIIAVYQMTLPTISQEVFYVVCAVFGPFAVWCLYMDIRQRRKKHKGRAEPSSRPDLQASKSDALRKLIETDSRDVFFSMLQNGELSAWSRTKGYPNLRPVRQSRWINDTLAYIDTNGVIETTIQNPLQRYAWVNNGKAIVNTDAYDIYFNKAELKKHWSALF